MGVTSKRKQTGSSVRRGVAAVEMAMVLPILCFIMVAGLDYARVMNLAVVTVNCARNGAIYQANPTASPYASLIQATQRDFVQTDYPFATNLPTVSTPVYGQDASGVNYVKVTVTYNFQTIMNYPGIPSTVPITRSVTAALAP